MRKDNLTALLTDLRALILKSRPAYRDYLGISVEEIPEKLIAYTAAIGNDETLFTISDDSFVTFSVGEQYVVEIDGEKQTVQASHYGEIPAILSFDPSAESSSESYWGIMASGGMVIGVAKGTYIGKGFSVSYPGKTIKEEKWDIKRLAYDLLPEKLLNLMDAAQNTADAAQSTADAAQSTADAAQSTADAAQSTADNAKTAAETAQTSINDSFIQRQKEFLFDKNTIGRDSFRFNAFSYYKIAEFAPSKESVVSFEGTRENGESCSSISHGTGCDEYGLFIVVTSTNNPTLPLGGTGPSVEISPPSTGLYARYEEGNTSETAGTAKFTLTSKQAVVLVSSTPNSAKKFKITVDDAGALSATEVTDTTA